MACPFNTFPTIQTGQDHSTNGSFLNGRRHLEENVENALLLQGCDHESLERQPITDWAAVQCHCHYWKQHWSLVCMMNDAYIGCNIGCRCVHNSITVLLFDVHMNLIIWTCISWNDSKIKQLQYYQTKQEMPVNLWPWTVKLFQQPIFIHRGSRLYT